MVNRHSRIPAILVLVAALGVGYAYLHIARANARPAGGLEALEAKIRSGSADKKDWLDYAAALNDAKKFGDAARAYKKVLEIEPYHRQAKFEVALALANAGDKEGLGAFLKDLVYSEAKLCVDLFERKELKAYLEDKEFENLQKEARAQAMD